MKHLTWIDDSRAELLSNAFASHDEFRAAVVEISETMNLEEAHDMGDYELLVFMKK